MKETVHVTEFKKDNEPVTDGKEIVNGFNDYFVNIGPNLAKKITANTNLSFKDYLKGSYMNSMLLSPVCEREIKKAADMIISCPAW